MFRNDQQITAAVRVLLKSVCLDNLQARDRGPAQVLFAARNPSTIESRDDAVHRGDVIVFEEEDLACMSELLGLGPRASFSDIVTALRAFVASYQRSRGLPVVRLVPQAGKPN